MLRVHARVVAEHEFLIVQHHARVVGGKEHAKAVHAACPAVGEIAHVIYHCRDDYKENDAERAVFKKRL